MQATASATAPLATAPSQGLFGAKARFYVFTAFMVLVLFTGGGSRADIQSLIILRPAAALLAGYALMTGDWRRFASLGTPFWLLVALAALIALQLVPLPPSIWRHLPARQVVFDIGESAGIAQPWRPLAYSPARAWNSLFALLVPACAMLLYAIQEPRLKRRVWPLIILLAGSSAVWGLMQLTGPSHGPLYTYLITSPGIAVGLFANRNHQAVFLACAILICAWYFRSLDPKAVRSRLLGPAALGAILLMLPMILLSGSRAGLATGGAALLMGLVFIARAPLLPERVFLTRTVSVERRVLALAIAGILLALVVLSIVFARALAVDRLLTEDPADNLRIAVLPVLLRMAGAFFPFGSGFGSFEFVYQVYEPTTLLGPRYLNEAHDDWLQWIIEGGLPGLLIAGVFAIWLVRTLRGAVRTQAGIGRDRRLLALGVIALLLVASFVDYPLRTPMLEVLFVLAALEADDGRKAATP
jgi:O-antigen ligase